MANYRLKSQLVTAWQYDGSFAMRDRLIQAGHCPDSRGGEHKSYVWENNSNGLSVCVHGGHIDHCYPGDWLVCFGPECWATYSGQEFSQFFEPMPDTQIRETILALGEVGMTGKGSFTPPAGVEHV